MSEAQDILQKNKRAKETYTGTNPKLFALWLFIISICMLFAGITSAYIVRKAEGNWLEFPLPSMFWVSTIVIVISSVSMQLSYYYANRNKLDILKVTVAVTFILGLVFLVTQFLGWKEMYNYDYKIVFGGKQANPSGSFLYVLTALHGAHLLGGLIFLLVLLILAFRYKIHSKKMLNVKMCTTYWHFLGGLWIYLFIFLVFNHLQ